LADQNVTPKEGTMTRILAFAAAALFAVGAQAQVLGFGSAPQGSIGYNMSSAIARAMAEAEGIQSRVQPYSGSSAVMPLVNSGELDLTVCNVLEMQEAVNGEGPYAGRKQANLRVLGVIFPLYSSIFVRRDSPIKSIADLKGKRVPYGFTAQVTLERIVSAILATGGLSNKDIVPVLVPNVIRGADDFMEGRIDGGFFAIGAAKVAEVHKAVGGIRYLPVPDDPAAIAAMRALMPYAYVTEVKPSPAFVGLDGPTRLMAYDYLVAVGAHVKDDVVYKIAKAMYENKAKLVESLRAFNNFNPNDMHKSMPATFHPGSVKYYKEKGIASK
jgi:TRAP transporter TAXI family solute receptor